MTKEEYDNMKAELIKQYNSDLNKLSAQYAMDNNPIKIGDIITSDYGVSIKVDKIGWTNIYLDKYPSCIYHGFLYTKKKVPAKSGERKSISQTRLEVKP